MSFWQFVLGNRIKLPLTTNSTLITCITKTTNQDSKHTNTVKILLLLGKATPKALNLPSLKSYIIKRRQRSRDAYSIPISLFYKQVQTYDFTDSCVFLSFRV